jgi:hypothetical protein
MSSFWAEKLIIATSLLAAFPLFFLDKELFGHRRFAWLVAMCTGLVTLFIVDPVDELADMLDKVTMAALCVTSVPHFLQLIKDSPWFGYSTIPPIFLVIHMSVETAVNSETYWRLRAFLHMAVFIIPYLNHLPSPPEEKKGETGGGEETEQVETTEAVTTTKSSSSKSNKTAKHKGGVKSKKKN